MLKLNEKSVSRPPTQTNKRGIEKNSLKLIAVNNICVAVIAIILHLLVCSLYIAVPVVIPFFIRVLIFRFVSFPFSSFIRDFIRFSVCFAFFLCGRLFDNKAPPKNLRKFYLRFISSYIFSFLFCRLSFWQNVVMIQFIINSFFFPSFQCVNL